MANELFTATKGKGAYLDSRRIRVSGCNSMQDALLATGFPFREGDNYDAYIKSMKVMMERPAVCAASVLLLLIFAGQPAAALTATGKKASRFGISLPVH